MNLWRFHDGVTGKVAYVACEDEQTAAEYFASTFEMDPDDIDIEGFPSSVEELCSLFSREWQAGTVVVIS